MKNPKELFEAIVNLASKALEPTEEKEVVTLSEEKVVESIEVIEKEVVLADEKKEEPKKEETKEAVAPVVEAPSVEQPAAVSKVEFDSAIAEIKEMYTKVLESISPSTPQEVPAALSEVKEEVELSEETIHDPEALVEKKEVILHSQGRAKTTQDYVFNQLFKNK